MLYEHHGLQCVDVGHQIVLVGVGGREGGRRVESHGQEGHKI